MVEATVQVTPRSISNRRNSTFAGPSGSCVENLYNLLHWTSWSIPISAIPVPFKSDVINAQRMITDRVSMKYWKSRVWSSTGMPKIRRRNLVTLFLCDGRHECGEFSWKFHTKLIFARALVTSKKMNQRTINIDLARNRNKHYLWKMSCVVPWGWNKRFCVAQNWFHCVLQCILAVFRIHKGVGINCFEGTKITTTSSTEAFQFFYDIRYQLLFSG